MAREKIQAVHLPKVVIDQVVKDEDVLSSKKQLSKARTGEFGDGKIFVYMKKNNQKHNGRRREKRRHRSDSLFVRIHKQKSAVEPNFLFQSQEYLVI
jgi:hypothetical protein